MKKTYFAPTSKVYAVKTADILAGSQLKVLSDGSGSDALGKSNSDDDWD